MTYNFFRQGWIVERVAAMAESGSSAASRSCSACLTRETLHSSVASRLHDDRGGLQSADRRRVRGRIGTFWLNDLRRQEHGRRWICGAARIPCRRRERTDWQQIAPTTIIHETGSPRFATDDWPFLYVRGQADPRAEHPFDGRTGRLGRGDGLSVSCPRAEGACGLDGRMFFLGAAFMLAGDQGGRSVGTPVRQHLACQFPAPIVL